jgi:anti-sigma factor RsiW
MKGFRETHGMDCERVGDEGLRADLMDVLYGEADAAARARVEEHLSGCTSCLEEMAALREVRRDLRAWRLPAVRPTFTPRGLVLPRWAAAAALLLLGFGATLGVTGYASLRRSLAAQEARAVLLERQHRETVEALEAALRSRASAPLDASVLLAGLDARIDERLRASESRQSERLDTRLAGWEERVDAQRRVDMARVAASLSYLDGRHGEQLARTNELMGYVIEASAQKR